MQKKEAKVAAVQVAPVYFNKEESLDSVKLKPLNVMTEGVDQKKELLEYLRHFPDGNG